ncbi:MAG: hypothetical protein NVS4B6_25800 [Mycobacterium sp.]
MTIAFNHVTKLVGAAMAAAALGSTIPSTAAADANDMAFIQKLSNDAINFGPPEAVQKRARMVCDLFGAGMSPADVHDTLLKGSTSVEGSSFSAQQAAIFMADAVQFYCPRYAGGRFEKVKPV